MKTNYLKSRHIGLTEQDQQQMLEVIGVKSVDELIAQTMPADILMKEPLDLDEPLTEQEHLSTMHQMAAKNQLYRSYIGRGWYGSITPAVIQRNILENPVWYTSYTPYQAEISQGRLEALFVYQTMISDLTGLPLANCSLLDEATAAAEAVTMMRNLRSRDMVKAGVKKVLVDKKIFENTLYVMRTRAKGQDIDLVMVDYAQVTPDWLAANGPFFGAIVQWPNAEGAIEDYTTFIDDCHAAGMKVTVIADLMALALLKPLNADIMCGTAQRMGLPLGYGGPTAGYMATREEYKRDMPGRIIGLSKDAHDKPAFRLALQTREQHIKREKATSNICTAEALSAIMVGMYGVYHGAEGIREIAEGIHGKAVYLSEMLQAYGYEQENTEFFDTLKIYPGATTIECIRQEAEERGINLYYDAEGWVGLSLDETVTVDDMNDIIDLFAAASDNLAQYEDGDEAFNDLWAISEEHVREVDYLQEDVFVRYHTETEMMRYLKRLERKDISLTHSMIPLGSCTMKLNPAAAMIPVSYPGFMGVHPLAPVDQVSGYQEVLEELEQQLATITGFAACNLQPTSGAAGEYAGLVTIREYLHQQGQDHRNILLIPASAHGTNPASCAQAGMIPVVVKCDENGNTDLADWREKAEQHKDNLAGCMITYPSTHGIFEMAIREMCQIVHDCGGQVYMDGANMNAQIGYTNPGIIGADVCHLNLHKSFASPHGGGGPGVGAICCAEHLVPALPTADLNRVSSALYGNANMALISYGYIRMMGEEGLRESTAAAILSANYMAAKLKDAYGIVYTGVTGRVGHELILDCRQFHAIGITESDIAKRLMDFGYHAPTLSFPVHGTLMIEPTESESLCEVDKFIDALLTIRKEIAEVETGKVDAKENVLVNSPHAEYEVVADEWNHPYTREKAAYPAAWVRENKFWLPVCRVDNGWGDRNLVARLEK
ncbi:MAG: aminomethyl-transferring glycine dehydrogenase [Paludibacteraceae bacterium]|nr:aminomethyl-transferring glycine dehydrogenase [Paludibacteraceae bacterium]